MELEERVVSRRAVLGAGLGLVLAGVVPVSAEEPKQEQTTPEKVWNAFETCVTTYYAEVAQATEKESSKYDALLEQQLQTFADTIIPFEETLANTIKHYLTKQPSNKDIDLRSALLNIGFYFHFSTDERYRAMVIPADERGKKSGAILFDVRKNQRTPIFQSENLDALWEGTLQEREHLHDIPASVYNEELFTSPERVPAKMAFSLAGEVFIDLQKVVEQAKKKYRLLKPYVGQKEAPDDAKSFLHWKLVQDSAIPWDDQPIFYMVVDMLARSFVHEAMHVYNHRRFGDSGSAEAARYEEFLPILTEIRHSPNPVDRLAFFVPLTQEHTFAKDTISQYFIDAIAQDPTFLQGVDPEMKGAYVTVTDKTELVVPLLACMPKENVYALADRALDRYQREVVPTFTKGK